MSVAAVTVVNSTIIASPARHDCPFQVAHPSIIGIPGGDHVSSVKKNGYKPWERKIKSSTGKVNIAAELETDMKREQKTEAAAPVHTSTYAPAVKKKASVTPAEALGAISLTFSPYGLCREDTREMEAQAGAALNSHVYEGLQQLVPVHHG